LRKETIVPEILFVPQAPVAGKNPDAASATKNPGAANATSIATKGARRPRRRAELPASVPGFPDFGHIRAAGITNARDLGGLPTVDGRRIKKRRLIRSSELSHASASDIKQMHYMHGVECVIDLRTDTEIEREPDPFPLMSGMEYIHLPVLSEDALGFAPGEGRLGRAATMARRLAKPFDAVKSIYTASILGDEGVSAYKALLRYLLSAPSGATLWHCTQGKDRTGVAAIIVEYVLGVPMEYIRADYLATNFFVGHTLDAAKRLADDVRFARRIDADITAFGYASMYYFSLAKRLIEDNYGSFESYIADTLDFGADDQAKLKEMYLEE
jgi:protein-tyrosine phosphatase